MRLNQILTHLESTLGKNLQLTRIAESLTNSTYRIKSHHGDWALRINNPDADLLGIDRDREQQILQAIQHESFTVPVTAVTDNYLVTQWVTGKKYSLDSTAQLNHLIALAQAIHQLPIAPIAETKALDIRRQIQTLKNKIELPRSADEKLTTLINEYKPASEHCLCHHDWHRSNLIQSAATLFLIDWEYAALGDPIIDWACLCSGFNCSPDVINTFLVKTNIDKERFSVALALVEMMSTLWFNQRHPNKNWQPEYLEWAARWTDIGIN